MAELVFEVFCGFIGKLRKLRGIIKEEKQSFKAGHELGVFVEEVGDFEGEGFVFLGEEVDFFLESIDFG